MPSITMDINPNSALHRKLLKAIKDRHNLSKRRLLRRHNHWRKAEDRVLAYMPERTPDAVRRNAREAGRPEYTTLTLPYTYAMLMTAHTYWTSVFLGRSPVFQYTARHGEPQMQVQAVEAMIDYQLQVGEMLMPLYIWLLDVAKYGLGVIHVYWDEQDSIVTEIKEIEEKIAGVISTGRMKKKKVIRRVPGYHGNKLYNIRPFDIFPDPRVPLNRFQDGEYFGVYAELGWNEIFRRGERGYYMNLDRLRKSARGPGEDHDQGTEQLEIPRIDDHLETSEQDAKTGQPGEANFFGLYDWFIELIPSEWGLGKSSYPEIWQFTVDKDFMTIIGARPQGAIHSKFPYQILEYETEGYALQSRGMPEVLDPIQRTIDWLLNSHFYNVRKALNHQTVVDPSRVVMKDLLTPMPGNVIRLKPAAYGTDPRLAVHQLNFQDVTQNHLRDIQIMHDFGQRTVGVNDQLMGVQTGSGRRSATEARQSAGFGINRQKTHTEVFSAQGFAPLSQMLLQNSQQYYDGEMKLQMVGDLIVEAGQQFIDVNPEVIGGFYNFVPVDGTMPIDRFAQANLWRDIMAGLRQIPEVGQRYDIARIFAWVAKLGGLKNIEQFKIQIQPDAVVQQQAQAGNLVPLPPADSERQSLPRQTAGAGPVG